MSCLFDEIKINEKFHELQNKPPFNPDKFEPVFTVSQLFETGIRATLYFVIRNGEPMFYDSKQERIF